MLRQDFIIFQSQSTEGLRVEIGASLLLLALVMLQVVHGAGPFLHSLAIFVLILLSLHLREMARAWVVRPAGPEAPRHSCCRVRVATRSMIAAATNRKS